MATDDKRLVTRISFLKAPIDILDEGNIEPLIRSMAARKEKQQIILLSFRDLMRARRNTERMRMLKEAALVLPVSKALIRGIKFLKKGDAKRYMPFEFIIRILGVLENIGGSIYILGAQTKEHNIIAGNLRDSFVGLKIVGRHAGFYSKDRENDLLLAIKKAAPNLLLAGNGLKGKELWLYKKKENFQNGLYFWSGECFDIFCGKKQRLSHEQWEKGYYLIPRFFQNPLRFFLIFDRIYYNFLLLIYRLRGL